VPKCCALATLDVTPWRAHRIAVEAVSPEIFGQVFATDEGDED
jgi:hypothetical protein